MRQRRIRYGLDLETNFVVSEVYGEGLAVPVIQFGDMGSEDNYEVKTTLEKFSLFSLATYYLRVKWTRKNTSWIEECSSKVLGVLSPNN